MLLAKRGLVSFYSTSAKAAGAAKTTKIGILMMNLGGPGNSKEVYPFLLRLFSDRDLIPLPFQKHLAKFIAVRRTPKIIEQYNEIGGGSPIKKWTEEQGSLMTLALNEHFKDDTLTFQHYIGFRYANPLTEEAIDQMLRDGVTRAIAFTQYPQYSCSTTGSSLNELHRLLKDADPTQKIKWSVIDRWPTHSGLIKAFTKLIQNELTRVSEQCNSSPNDTVLLFTAHSLPMSVVNRGDPYPAEVAATVYAIMKELGFSNPYRLVWQSKVGPSAWLGPQTSDAIEGLLGLGYQKIVLVPVAFTSDHVETLYELDQEYIKQAREKLKGIKGASVSRCQSLNVEPIFVNALSDLVKEHVTNLHGHSSMKQLSLRCPGCVNPKCGESKSFFLNHHQSLLIEEATKNADQWEKKRNAKEKE